MKDLAAIQYDNSDAGLAERRAMADARAERAFNAQAQRNAQAGDLHDEILDCIFALEVETSPRHGMAAREKAIAALSKLYGMATKVEK